LKLGGQHYLIGMEACRGAHDVGCAFLMHGHEVRLMPPRYVRPFVKTQKNDYLDAEANAEAVQRPTMRFVPQKTVEQDITGARIVACARCSPRNIRWTTSLTEDSDERNFDKCLA
jgi:transposase